MNVFPDRSFILPLAIVVAGTVSFAQVPRAADSYEISGTVYDSIANVPLSGAVVDAILLDSTGNPTYTSISDSTGRFVLSNLPGGRYAFMFEHNVLTVLGLDPPSYAVTIVGPRHHVTVDLGIPEGKTVRMRACSGQRTGALLAGQITSARTGQGLSGALVIVRWSELTVDGRRLSTHVREMKTVADVAGRYRVCNLPLDGELSVHVSVQNYRPLDLAVAMGSSAVVRRDWRLSGLSAIGTSVLAFRVIDNSQANITSGTLEIAALHRVARIESGRALISELPAGTWVVDIRSLGYEPATVVVDVPSINDYTVRLDRLPHMLDSVRVGADAPREARIVQAAQSRLLVAHGTLIRADNPSLRSATLASDPVRAATGFRWKGPTSIDARPYVNRRGQLKDCQTLTESDSLGSDDDKKIAIYVDGSRVPGGIQVVNRMVPPRDILVIEAYPDVVSAPFQWRQNDTCAVIAFWTRR